jgi:hypothetical protein
MSVSIYLYIQIYIYKAVQEVQFAAGPLYPYEYLEPHHFALKNSITLLILPFRFAQVPDNSAVFILQSEQRDPFSEARQRIEPLIAAFVSRTRQLTREQVKREFTGNWLLN